MTTSLGRRSWDSVGSAALVLVPTGSTEQHGPHLPLDTDSIIAGAVATELAARLALHRPAGSVLVAPTLRYGASGEHQGFPGTVSIGADALRFMLVEMVRSLSTWAGSVVFVNGHGGNVAALSSAVVQLGAEGHRVAWLPCAVPGGDAHAGHTETSLLLHLCPDAVDMSAAVKGNVRPAAELMPSMRSGGVRAVSKHGILGDPTRASARDGADFFELMLTGAARRISAADPDARGCLRDPGTAGDLI